MNTKDRNNHFNIFDTGIHYIGGLGKGENLYKFFNYIGIMQDLELKKLDEDGFDFVTFDDHDVEYCYAQGMDNFVATLSKQFPGEEEAIRTYADKLIEVCDHFPLYNLRHGNSYDEDLLSISAKEYIESLTDNTVLQAVLGGTNYLYAGDGYRTPFYVHALAVKPYIESSWRCVNGGSQITKLVLRKLREHGGEAYRHQEVTKFNFDGDDLVSVSTKNGTTVKGDLFISNIEPKLTIKMLGENRLKKPYVKRVRNIETIISVFSIHIVFKPKSFKYRNYNYYHCKHPDGMWNAQEYTEESWPEGYMVSMSCKKNMGEWAENMTVMTYMNFDEMAPWVDTFNTVADKNPRGENYEEFKARKTEGLLKEVEKKFPNIREAMFSIYASTPLSYRDYIGVHRGNMYGSVKDVANPMRSFLSPRTRIKNLYLTGQSVNMHGVLGVTISAVLTCSTIVGREYLLNKIIAANEEDAVADVEQGENGVHQSNGSANDSGSQETVAGNGPSSNKSSAE